MFVVPNREVFFDLSEFIPNFELTSIKHNEFNIINATDKMLIIIFHNNLKFAIIGLSKEEQDFTCSLVHYRFFFL